MIDPIAQILLLERPTWRKDGKNEQTRERLLSYTAAAAVEWNEWAAA